jgi:hypothetical protein
VTEPTPEDQAPGAIFGGPAPVGPAYPGPPPPGYGSPPPGYGSAPLKSQQTAGLLGIFLGAIGVHRFYLGYTSIGVLQILVTIATFGLGGFWGMIEGILILTGTGITTDADGRPLRGHVTE